MESILRRLHEWPIIKPLREIKGQYLRRKNRIRDLRTLQDLSRLLQVYDLDEFSQVRIGNRNGDGGYVIHAIPERFATIVLSYGINDDISFESELSQHYPNSMIHLFDHTVPPPTELSENHLFHPEGVAESKTPNVDTLSAHIHRYSEPEDWIFIKMDVEGCEFDAFRSISQQELGRVSQLAIEIHGISKYNKSLIPLLKRLSRFFVVTHLHANNGSPLSSWCGYDIPELIEVTLVNRKISGTPRKSEKRFPTPLDAPNICGQPEHDINFLRHI